jgi:hypothetical protein
MRQRTASFIRSLTLEEEIYVIAMHLDLFVRHCFPKWSTVFTVASKVMADLATEDPEFHNHLKNIAKIRTKVNTKVRSIDISLKRFISLTVRHRTLSQRSSLWKANRVVWALSSLES